MTRKRKLPEWLAAALGLVLVVLMMVVAVMSSMEQPEPWPVVTSSPKIVFEGTLPASAPEAGMQEERVELPVSKGIGLILDDAGFDLHALERVLALTIPVAIAVLPGAPYAHQAATLAHEGGQVVMLHLPMEPSTPKYRKKMTDTFLRADMSGDELRKLFLLNLERVPYAEGVNNHMGSVLTELRNPMSQVMQVCREKGLFFIDSKTSSKSVASELAGSMDVPWEARRFFLDHSSDEQEMAATWNRARECARQGYSCIVIAHPHAETVSFLESHLTDDDRGLIRPLKQLLKRNPLQAGKTKSSLEATL